MLQLTVCDVHSSLFFFVVMQVICVDKVEAVWLLLEKVSAVCRMSASCDYVISMLQQPHWLHSCLKVLKQNMAGSGLSQSAQVSAFLNATHLLRAMVGSKYAKIGQKANHKHRQCRIVTCKRKLSTAMEISGGDQGRVLV